MGANAADAGFAEKLFAGIGPEVLRTSEELIDAFTSAAGSGPAYVFALAEAMQAAAQRQGFDAASARAMVMQTIKGAALMMDQSDESAAVLRARVTSKGGTTEAALAAMMAGGFATSIGAGMDAANQIRAQFGNYSNEVASLGLEKDLEGKAPKWEGKGDGNGVLWF